MQGSSFCLATHRELLYLRSWLSIWVLCFIFWWSIACIHLPTFLPWICAAAERAPVRMESTGLAPSLAETARTWSPPWCWFHQLNPSQDSWRLSCEACSSNLMMNTKRAKVLGGYQRFAPPKKPGNLIFAVYISTSRGSCVHSLRSN